MVAAPLPAGLDPAYVRTLTSIDPTSGRPQRWGGGPLMHCFGASLAPYRSHLEAIADRLTVVSGVPRAEGRCNVEWVEDPQEEKAARTYAGGTATSLTHATIRIQRPAEIPLRPALFLHEGGHVLGLRHSDVPTDVMNPDVVGNIDFSPNELAVLAWMYGR